MEIRSIKNTCYQITENGNVYSLKNNKWLKPISDGRGYLAGTSNTELAKLYKVHNGTIHGIVNN